MISIAFQRHDTFVPFVLLADGMSGAGRDSSGHSIQVSSSSCMSSRCNSITPAVTFSRVWRGKLLLPGLHDYRQWR